MRLQHRHRPFQRSGFSAVTWRIGREELISMSPSKEASKDSVFNVVATTDY
jgi:hypothetical protein